MIFVQQWEGSATAFYQINAVVYFALGVVARR